MIEGILERLAFSGDELWFYTNKRALCGGSKMTLARCAVFDDERELIRLQGSPRKRMWTLC